mmetsp:Transcript_30374/g.93760  ORF Transcript_30374/g.93760 Transcript_30374/m.93760 type:complete len:201 (-) Transcript_30374:17-619(-)
MDRGAGDHADRDVTDEAESLGRGGVVAGGELVDDARSGLDDDVDLRDEQVGRQLPHRGADGVEQVRRLGLGLRGAAAAVAQDGRGGGGEDGDGRHLAAELLDRLAEAGADRRLRLLGQHALHLLVLGLDRRGALLGLGHHHLGLLDDVAGALLGGRHFDDLLARHVGAPPLRQRRDLARRVVGRPAGHALRAGTHAGHNQ